VNLKKNQGKLQ